MTRSAAALLAALAALSAPSVLSAQADPGVTLVRCGEKDAFACLHVRTTLSPERAGALAPREGADGGWLLRHDGAELSGRPAAVPREARPPLRLLVLVDVSGSMSDGGLQTARSALRAFLAELPAGSVRAAVVPFASARVAEGIRAARFVPAPQAAAQVDALPAPVPSANTALYSAVRDGMERLAAEPAPGDTAWNALLVVTDGDNDVGRPGDDPGLLEGDDGRRRAVEAVRASGAWAWVVGIGPGPDTAELRALSAPRGASYAVAEDPLALRRALERIQGWIFTGREFLLPVDGSVQARLAAGPAGVEARAGETAAGGTWVPPVFALPAFQGRAAGPVDGDEEDPWRLRRAAVLAFFAGVLLVLWTTVPPLLGAPPPRPAPARSGSLPLAQPVAGGAARPRIRLRGGGAPIPVAGVVTIAPDGLRPGLSEAPPRRPTDVTAKVSRPVQRT